MTYKLNSTWVCVTSAHSSERQMVAHVLACLPFACRSYLPNIYKRPQASEAEMALQMAVLT